TIHVLFSLHYLALCHNCFVTTLLTFCQWARYTHLIDVVILAFAYALYMHIWCHFLFLYVDALRMMRISHFSIHFAFQGSLDFYSLFLVLIHSSKCCVYSVPIFSQI
ncbi:hypothetical protein ACJX0J_023803, partial [Zea mays]